MCFVGGGSSGGIPMNAQSKTQNSPVTQYFMDVWAGIKTTYVGMKLTLGYFFRPSVTLRYPETRPCIPPGHRGLHAFDETKCTYCQICVKNCPVACIHIDAKGRAKDTLVLRYDVDYSRCLFCNICAEACPQKCVWLTEEYNFAHGTREGCVLSLARPKSDVEIVHHQVLLDQKEAERKSRLAQKEIESKAREKQQQEMESE
jgi:NADH-quinone oxidoreductase subunit I